MSVKEIVVDVSQWNQDMIENLLWDVNHIDEAVKLNIEENPRPPEFTKRLRRLNSWHEQWEKDTASIVENESIPRYVRAIIRATRPYDHRYDGRLSVTVWVKPGINNLQYPYTGWETPPTFAEMVKRARKRGRLGLYGIGKKYTKVLLDALGEQP